MDEDKKKGDNEKAGSSQELEEKHQGAETASNSSSSIDFLNQARKSANIGKKNKRLPQQKKKKRSTGKVQKKKKEVKKMRRKPCPRNMREKRRLNTRTHRKLKRNQQKENHPSKKSVSATCQMGPPSCMYSKLYVGGSPMMAQNSGYANDYKEISPEMIYRSLYDLAMWRDAISTEAIFNYIKNRHPINPNTNEAVEELLDKLRVAQIAGIAWALPNECWRLTTALERNHRLDFTHVTLFWKAYYNTMKPLDKNRQKRALQSVATEDEKVTDDII